MSITYDLSLLSDRAAISDLVIAYATALDSRNWMLFRSIFTDTVTIDYRSFDPSLQFTVPADEWVNMMSSGFGGFDSTLHMSTNHVHDIKGNEAICVSYMQASHFFVRDGKTECATYFGYYVNGLVRRLDGWRLCGITLQVTAGTGDMRVFEWAKERLAAPNK